MSKTKQQKQEAVGELEAGIKASKAVVFANFQGLDVSSMEELRKSCRENDIDMLVAKKTLVKLACENAGLTNFDPKSFEGGVATLLGHKDEISPAKTVNNFAKTHTIVKIFGGVLEGKFIDEMGIKSLANLPSRDELLAKVVGSINAPISGFVNALAGNLRNLVCVLNAVKESKN